MTGKYFHTDTFKVTEHNILCMLCCSKHARTHTHTHSHTRALLCTCMYVRTWHTHYLVLFLSLISLRLTQNDPIPSKIYIMHARTHACTQTYTPTHTNTHYTTTTTMIISSLVYHTETFLLTFSEKSPPFSPQPSFPRPPKRHAHARAHTLIHTHTQSPQNIFPLKTLQTRMTKCVYNLQTVLQTRGLRRVSLCYNTKHDNKMCN